MPPVTEAPATPELPPWHFTSVLFILTLRTVGWMITTESIFVCPAPLLSFTVTLYLPGDNPPIESDVAELDQEYKYGNTPPEQVTLAVPLLLPLQVTLVPLMERTSKFLQGTTF